MRTYPSTQGTLEPVSLTELKKYLRIESGDIEDAVLTSLLAASRKACEEYARIAISPREFVSVFRPAVERRNQLVGRFSLHDPDNTQDGLLLRRRPVRSLTSVTFKTRDGSEYETPDYVYDEDEAKVIWSNGPVVPSGIVTGIHVKYEAGFPPNSENEEEATICVADETIKAAVMETTLAFYDDRGLDGADVLPARARGLLRGYFRLAGS